MSEKLKVNMMYVETIQSKNPNHRTNCETDQKWTGIRNGCEKSFSDLYCLYYHRLFRYGYSISANHELIKDSIQELFLVIWSHRNTINKAHSVKAYLFCSMRRIMFRNLHKQRNRYERNRDYIENNFQELFNIEELLVYFEIEREKKNNLIEALNFLSNRQKEAVYLKFYDGLTNDEISNVMNINKQSVYNHISEAINQLQQYVR